MNSAQEVRRSWGVLSEMLKDRGWDAASCARVSVDDLAIIAGGHSIFHVDLLSCGARVIYNLNPRFKLSDVQGLLEADDKDDGANAPPKVFIVITRDTTGPTHSALKGVRGRDVQFFDLQELQYNVSRHTLVPLHEPLRDPVAIKAILERYALKQPKQLPLIQNTDPMARYLALKPDQLVRITRVCPSAGTTVCYRCCSRA